MSLSINTTKISQMWKWDCLTQISTEFIIILSEIILLLTRVGQCALAQYYYKCIPTNTP
jgi:hypothetical protein